MELQQQRRNMQTASSDVNRTHEGIYTPKSVRQRLRAYLPGQRATITRSGSLSTAALMHAASSGPLPDPEFLIHNLGLETPFGSSNNASKDTAASSLSLETPSGLPANAPGRRGWQAGQLGDRLPAAPVIEPDDIELCKGEDGQDWLLGAGTYGAVCWIYKHCLLTAPVTVYSPFSLMMLALVGMACCTYMHCLLIAPVHDPSRVSWCHCLLSVHTSGAGNCGMV